MCTFYHFNIFNSYISICVKRMDGYPMLFRPGIIFHRPE